MFKERIIERSPLVNEKKDEKRKPVFRTKDYPLINLRYGYDLYPEFQLQKFSGNKNTEFRVEMYDSSDSALEVYPIQLHKGIIPSIEDFNPESRSNKIELYRERLSIERDIDEEINEYALFVSFDDEAMEKLGVYEIDKEDGYSSTGVIKG